MKLICRDLIIKAIKCVRAANLTIIVLPWVIYFGKKFLKIFEKKAKEIHLFANIFEKMAKEIHLFTIFSQKKSVVLRTPPK